MGLHVYVKKKDLPKENCVLRVTRSDFVAKDIADIKGCFYCGNFDKIKKVKGMDELFLYCHEKTKLIPITAD